LRITANEVLTEVNNRRHLMRLVGRAMRQILADRARRRHVRGTRMALDAILDSLAEENVDAVELRDALELLEKDHPRPAEVVTLRFFFRETIEATADLLKVSPSTVESDWRFAQAWLYRRLNPDNI